MNRTFQKLLQPLYRRIRLILRRGVLTGSDSSPKMQTVQVQLTPDLTLEMEHFEPYGFTSNPQDGAEPVVANIEGKSHPVSLLIADRRFRVQSLAKGEVAIATDEGDVIHFKRGNEILIDTANKLTANAGASATITSPLVNIVASTKVTMTTPECEITGVLNVGGNINSAAQVSDATGSMQGMRDTYNGHAHPGDSGGTTGSPDQSM